jgi:hypothetical protein
MTEHQVGRRGSACIVVGALLCVLATPVDGQSPEWAAIGLSAAWHDIRMFGYGTGGEESLDGMLYGVEASASFWRLRASGEYRQGRLWQHHLAGADTRVISARASLGVQLFPWVALVGGPLVTSIGTPAGDRRTIRWRVGTALSVPLVGDLVNGFATFAGSVAGTAVQGVIVPESGGGGEVGLMIAPEGRPVWARLGYRVDREYLQVDQSQTIETAFLTLGVSIPRARSAR